MKRGTDVTDQWQHPRRIVQTNLQVTDALTMEPARLVDSIVDELHADTLVFNVGGIYAWYPTKVPFHVVNPHLDAGRDLVREVLDACHARDVRFIARVDFSKTDDSVYHQHPEWFVQRPDGLPVVVGESRPGPWRKLYAACGYGGYRRDGVAIPVLREIVRRYEVEAIFMNGTEFALCFCGSCQERYRLVHGTPMPSRPEDIAPGWTERGFADTMETLIRTTQEIVPNVPWILGTYVGDGRDMVGLSTRTGCLLCAEPLDRFGDGVHKARPRWWAAANTSVAGGIGRGRRPMVIIHACSGLAWRHVSLPPAEHRFWLAQAAALGGSIWHSLTGMPTTQRDRRILDTVSAHNAVLERIAPWLEGTSPVASVAVAHSRSSCPPRGDRHVAELSGALDALTDHHLLWTVYPDELLDEELPQGVSVVVLAGVQSLPERIEEALVRAVNEGLGLVILRPPATQDRSPLDGILPVEWHGHAVRDTDASYGRIEAGGPLASDVPALARTQLVPWRGSVLVGKCREGAMAWLTYVPSFAPLDGAGSPPERAVIPTERTAIPLVAAQGVGKGRVVEVMGSLGDLIHTYRLPDHAEILAALVRWAANAPQPVEVDAPPGVIVGAQAAPDRVIVQLVNGVGERPLAATPPAFDVTVRVPMLAGQAVEVTSLHHPDGVPHDGETPSVTLRLDAGWEVVQFRRTPRSG